MLRKNAFFSLFLAALLLLTACASDKTVNDSEYTVFVTSEGGLALQGVRVVVYKDATLTSLLHTAETDKEGKITFKKPESSTYTAVLSDLPRGYVSEESYLVDNTNCTIRLKAVIGNTDISQASYGLGSVMSDFTVTSVEGNSYTLSELLKTKKAVMLNFWFINCGPCKSEFPYIQQAYDEYKDEIEILAINPTGDSASEIASYASNLGLTFPFAEVGMEWQNAFHIMGYPTTVVIDRYGTICFLHTGSIPDKETFVKIFEHFTADDYQQIAIRKVSDIK